MVKVKTNIKCRKSKSIKGMKKNKTNIEKNKKAIEFFMRDFVEEITKET